MVAGATAGIGAKFGYSPTELSFDTNSAQLVGIKVASDAVIKTAVYGGSFKDNLGDAAVGAGIGIAGAIGANQIGDQFNNGSLSKIAMHAALGGLMAEAMGGDFRTGALAAGASEALVEVLASKLLPDNLVKGTPEYEQGVRNLLAASQVVGVLAAVAAEGDVNVGAAVAANATANNWLLHQEIDAADTARASCNGAANAQACKDNVTRAIAALDAERQRDHEEYVRQVQLQAYQEGWTRDEFNTAISAYWTGIDTSQVTTGYKPAFEPMYVGREAWGGVKNSATTLPGKAADGVLGFLDALWSPIETAKTLFGGAKDTAVGAKDWLTSPIPAHDLERAIDKYATASPAQAGGLVFDALTGIATAVVGGKAVEWIGGKWVARSGVSVADVDSPNIGELDAPKQQSWKYENRTDVTRRTAAEVNAEFPESYSPPYKPGTQVVEYTTKDYDKFVRVHNSDNPNRPWMMRKEAIEGLTAEQIQQKYSLPVKPKYISDVEVPPGTRMRTGKVETNFELQGGGGSGATQYEWRSGRVPLSAIKNTRRLN